MAISALGRPDFAVFLGSYIFLRYPMARGLCAAQRRWLAAPIPVPVPAADDPRPQWLLRAETLKLQLGDEHDT